MSDVLAHKTRTCPYCGAPIKPGVNTAIKRDGLASLRDVARKTELVAPAPGQAVAAARPTTSGQAVASFLFAVLGAGLGAIPALVLGHGPGGKSNGPGGTSEVCGGQSPVRFLAASSWRCLL
jgi:hypothetical protein